MRTLRNLFVEATTTAAVVVGLTLAAFGFQEATEPRMASSGSRRERHLIRLPRVPRQQAPRRRAATALPGVGGPGATAPRDEAYPDAEEAPATAVAGRRLRVGPRRGIDRRRPKCTLRNNLLSGWVLQRAQLTIPWPSYLARLSCENDGYRRNPQLSARCLRSKTSRSERPETHRYHRNEANPLRCLKGHSKGLPYVSVPMIVGPLDPIDHPTQHVHDR